VLAREQAQAHVRLRASVGAARASGVQEREEDGRWGADLEGAADGGVCLGGGGVLAGDLGAVVVCHEVDAIHALRACAVTGWWLARLRSANYMVGWE
jgi:hypothetical protein